MKLKYFSLILLFTTITYAEAAQRNLCDDLIDSGTSSAEQIKKCLSDPRFGPSTYYKEQEANKKAKIEVAKTETEAENKNKDNLEIRIFNAEQLKDAGFGKPFYAIRGDYRNHGHKEKRITEGDALCSYLGYEKAIKSIVSAETWENKNGNSKVDKQGLVIDTNILGIVSKTPEIYRDEEFNFTVRSYVEITCIKRKDKTIEGTKAALKSVTEDLLVLNEELNAPAKSDPNARVNNGSRSNNLKTGKTQNGYNPPEWVKDTKTLSK